MCPEELVLLVTALALSMAKEIPLEDLGIYSDIFMMLGDTLAVYISQSEYLEAKCTTNDSSKYVS